VERGERRETAEEAAEEHLEMGPPREAAIVLEARLGDEGHADAALRAGQGPAVRRLNRGLARPDEAVAGRSGPLRGA